MSNGAMLAADTSGNAVCDKVYTFGKNGESAALSAGTIVYVDPTAADGITFKKGTSTNIGMPMGVLEEDVPAGAYTAKIVRHFCGLAATSAPTAAEATPEFQNSGATQ